MPPPPPGCSTKLESPGTGGRGRQPPPGGTGPGPLCDPGGAAVGRSLADNALAPRGDTKLGELAAAPQHPGGSAAPAPQAAARGEPGGSPKSCGRSAPAGSHPVAPGAEPWWGRERGPSVCTEPRGRAFGSLCGAALRPPGRQPLPPRALGGEMSSGGSSSSSLHCCPWERGRGRAVPLFSPGAAAPQAHAAAPPGVTAQLAAWARPPGGTGRGGPPATAGLHAPRGAALGTRLRPRATSLASGASPPAPWGCRGDLETSRPRGGCCSTHGAHRGIAPVPPGQGFSRQLLAAALRHGPGSCPGVRCPPGDSEPVLQGARGTASRMGAAPLSLQRQKPGDPRIPSSPDFVCLVYCVALGINH